MDLQKYQDQELKGVIRSLRVMQGKAKDSGNIYYYIQMVFVNGYEKRIFLNNDETFAWVNAFDVLEQDRQLVNEYNG